MINANKFMFWKKLNKSDFLNEVFTQETPQFNRVINFTIAQIFSTKTF